MITTVCSILRVVRLLLYMYYNPVSWLRGTALERPSLVGGELTVTTYVRKPFFIGQPPRPTQPFIPSGSIDE